MIINPNAGCKMTAKDMSQIKSAISVFSDDPEITETTQPGEAIAITRQQIEKGHRKIIVVGGDGTFNEAVNGIFGQDKCDPSDITLGIIPVGTGNDWKKMYNIPDEYKEAAEIIKRGQTLAQDVGIVKYQNSKGPQSRYFANVAGIGFDARVARRVNREKLRGRSGGISYIKNLLLSLINTKSRPCRISIDGKSSNKTIFSMSVGIGKFNGGGIMQLPHALPDDGRLAATMIEKVGKIDVLLNLPKIFDGRILTHPKVKSAKGTNIIIESKSRFMLEADGESLGHGPFEFGIIPRAIRVISGSAGIDFGLGKELKL